MEQPHSCLVELLKCPGVSHETKAVLKTLKHRCGSVKGLETFILKSLDEYIRGSDIIFSEFLPGILMAKELNMQANKWLSDFLLFVIGKRSRSSTRHLPYHPNSLNWPYAARSRRAPPQAKMRQCTVSGSTQDVRLVQLIPLSEDPDRLARFNKLAKIFLPGNVLSMSAEEVRSTENCIFLSTFWRSCLDKGRLIIRFINGQFHAIPRFQYDLHRLAAERSTNSMDGPVLMSPNLVAFPISCPGLSIRLTWIHQFLVNILWQTGIYDQLISDIDWVENLPSTRQSIEALDQLAFATIVTHKLSIM